MTIKKSMSWVLAACLVILSVGACGSLPDEKKFSKGDLTVSFPRLIGIEDQLEDYQIDHPVSISEKMVGNHLASIWYQRIEPPGKPSPVFLPHEVDKLSPLFKAALNRVEGGNYVHFEYQSPNGLTEGDVFASVDKIHWRFSSLGGVYFSNKLLGLTDRTWKLVRRVRGQKYHMEKTAVVRIAQENWMVNNKALPTLKRRPSSQSTTQRKHPHSSNTPSKSKQMSDPLKAKLKRLKELFDDGLISEKDYEMKKKELLNQNF